MLTFAFLNSHFESGLKSPLDEAILAHEQIDCSGWKKIDEAPFDFERRRVSVLLEHDGQRSLIIKGAPEDLMRLCVAVDLPDGGVAPLDTPRRAELLSRFEGLSLEGYRLLGIARRDEGPQATRAEPADERDLVFVGFVAFVDPPKASAAAALKGLAEAGVDLKILTGDNEAVARHVCGQLAFEPGRVINGPELARLSDEALMARLPHTRLFCRVTPQQKLRVILMLKRLGRSVGFLGDGINDAPALHAADAGISVDTAADVAQGAADVILLEQDLGVVCRGVLEGRRTIANTSKYILMASSANFGNIFSMVLAGLFLPFLPLLPIQVLLTNLVYDVAQTGLPLDEVDPEAIARPIHWDLRLIERFMVVMGPVSTLYDVITFVVLLRLFHAGEALFRTGWFVESLVTQILMVFAVRTRRSLFRTRPHPLVAGLAVGAAALTVGLPYLPYVSTWFQFVRFGWAYLAYLAIVTTAFLATVEAVKRAFYARLASSRSPRAPRRASGAAPRPRARSPRGR
ncbi:MAG TPA: HAD-IC family P-type ATPase [Caulobacteraceae bacterium]|nr:HAD-IC family P-type ATPase [Caulobacteraceae bacterium]